MSRNYGTTQVVMEAAASAVIDIKKSLWRRMMRWRRRRKCWWRRRSVRRKMERRGRGGGGQGGEGRWRRRRLLLSCSEGRRGVIRISGSVICSETLMELIFNPCSEFRWSPEGPFSQIHSPHLHAELHGIISDLLMSVQILKRKWGAESSGKLPHLFIPSKTATLVPVYAVEDLPLGRTAVLVPEFPVKDLPLGRTL